VCDLIPVIEDAPGGAPCGRSLFRESGDLWQKLSNSYNKRNGIIHRGENAHEDDARQALDVTRKVVEILSAF
jgi:hypothetical protein